MIHSFGFVAGGDFIQYDPTIDPLAPPGSIQLGRFYSFPASWRATCSISCFMFRLRCGHCPFAE